MEIIYRCVPLLPERERPTVRELEYIGWEDRIKNLDRINSSPTLSWEQLLFPEGKLTTMISTW